MCGKIVIVIKLHKYFISFGEFKHSLKFKHQIYSVNLLSIGNPCIWHISWLIDYIVKCFILLVQLAAKINACLSYFIWNILQKHCI